MGMKLGEKIVCEWEDLDIDVVISILEILCDIALEIVCILGKLYRQGFVKNRYVGCIFIMSGQQLCCKFVCCKLNVNCVEFCDKNVLLVDDFIVCGIIFEQIIEMVCEVGVKKVYFVFAVLEIRFLNVYGIDMSSVMELIVYGREVDEIRQIIGVDGLIFQDLNDLIDVVCVENLDIQQFECSVFNGVYVIKDVDQGYFDFFDMLCNDDVKVV